MTTADMMHWVEAVRRPEWGNTPLFPFCLSLPACWAASCCSLWESAVGQYSEAQIDISLTPRPWLMFKCSEESNLLTFPHHRRSPQQFLKKAFSVCRNALLRNRVNKKVCFVAMWNHQSDNGGLIRLYTSMCASGGVGCWWWSFVVVSARRHTSGYKNNTHKDRTKQSAVELRCGQLWAPDFHEEESREENGHCLSVLILHVWNCALWVQQFYSPLLIFKVYIFFLLLLFLVISG